MNVIISCDIHYLDKAEVLIYSLSRTTKEHINLYFLNNSLDRNDIDVLKLRIKKYRKVTLHCIDIKGVIPAYFPVSNSFPIEVYSRVFAHLLLPQDVDRVIWLDIDMIVRKDLSKIYHQDFDGKYLMACCDCSSYKGKVRLGIESSHIYFNSGFMIMNCSLMRSDVTFDNIIEVVDRFEGKEFYYDQDLLNCLYENKVKYIDWHVYNYPAPFDDGVYVKYKDRKKIAIIHYLNWRKPWGEHMGVLSRYWWRNAIFCQGYSINGGVVAHLKYTKNITLKNLFRHRKKVD